ncbi:hypothetical protein BN2475_50095 [Paraburkholderia ribeironis]|uniref:Uncharacterized protein n=1 Tax=Paraburkholderia ribeironis TaxID=1247936 RepID=A0A1N7RKD9_9BURK|nr:hypothetical protein [Paraburkholderia ribeironis]SIT35570.1 hypothetical protein BN2475_50095 [Paraburkholderia ribeironis]
MIPFIFKDSLPRSNWLTNGKTLEAGTIRVKSSDVTVAPQTATLSRRNRVRHSSGQGELTELGAKTLPPKLPN